MAMSKDLRKYLQGIIESEGFRVEYGKHIKLYHPNPAVGIIVLSSTPSGGYAVKNAQAQIKRELRKIA
jgi:hypothetical protein